MLQGKIQIVHPTDFSFNLHGIVFFCILFVFISETLQDPQVAAKLSRKLLTRPCSLYCGKHDNSN